MGAIYDTGLYDADDVIKPYTDGYNDAAQRVSLVERFCCPHCSTCLSTLASIRAKSHPLFEYSMLFLL